MSLIQLDGVGFELIGVLLLRHGFYSHSPAHYGPVSACPPLRVQPLLPAALTSGGQVLLAELDGGVLESLYRSNSARTSGDFLDEADFDRFRRRLDSIRRVGFALNRERTERGVAALGMAVREADGEAVAAVSISVPARHAGMLDAPDLHAALGRACRVGA
ncbi:IclR family transcriptional regulator domain-containing protein [Brevibacterium sandarakinum]|uniref:IclR family transcriptional regulator domain-containing protein n=1 Tax=Brevibacterium sandarakinum TaxID=629680 RepID=UPI000B860F50|nr:IclR family transcriptional regulator C-terminal domain-containing protein [Brevibacterium sandarakinum]